MNDGKFNLEFAKDFNDTATAKAAAALAGKPKTKPKLHTSLLGFAAMLAVTVWASYWVARIWNDFIVIYDHRLPMLATLEIYALRVFYKMWFHTDTDTRKFASRFFDNLFLPFFGYAIIWLVRAIAGL